MHHPPQRIIEELSQSLLAIPLELSLLGGMLALLLLHLLLGRSAYWPAALLTVGYFIVVAFFLWQAPLPTDPQFFGLLQSSSFARQAEWLLLLVAFLAALFPLLSRPFYPSKTQYPEYFYFLLAGLVGALVLVKARSLMSLFLAVELLSISGYVLLALQPSGRSAKAILNYLLFGGFASALMLFGISYLYGLSGSLSLQGPSLSADLPPLLAPFAWGLFLAGLLFKLAAFPFSAWVPGVYRSSTFEGLTFLTLLPKVAAACFLLGWARHHSELAGPLLGFLALLTMTLGNAAALRQKQPRTLMGYSSVAQAGFLLLPIAFPGEFADEALLFYLATYALATFGIFLLLEGYERAHGVAQLRDFAGLGHHKPFQALLITLLLVSLIGLPPLAGFTGKFFLFSVLAEAYQTDSSLWLLVLLVGSSLNTAIALAYYLRIPYHLFFQKRSATAYGRAKSSELMAATAAGLLLLGFFFLPGQLLELLDLLRL